MDNSHSSTVIYLPSSGGHAGSRITSELVTRRRFPFRRYSVEEDGSLSVRVRYINHDARPRPYPRPGVRFSSPPSRRPSPSLNLESPRATPAPDSHPTAELLKSLIPALVGNPTDLEASISSICAAYDIDQSVISVVTQAAKRRSSVRPLERTRTLDRSTPSVSNIPSSSSTVFLVPFKRERPFPSGHRGATTWFTTQSCSDVTEPPHGLPEVAGHLYIHRNISTSTHQIWLLGRDARWNAVSDSAKTVHPTLLDRVLSFRSDGTPNWVTITGFTNVQGRKARASER